jgi:ribosome biogenesis SPOUT family RNA methylase Rps3
VTGRLAGLLRRLTLPRAERRARKSAHMAPAHPERLTRELPEADEETLAERCAEMWPEDEYELAIIIAGGVLTAHPRRASGRRLRRRRAS